MPPERLLSEPVIPSTPPPNNPQGRWRKWLLVIVSGLVLLTGIGYGVSIITSHQPAKPTLTPSPAPPITAAERSKVADRPLGTTQLDVTDLTAQNAAVVNLLAKALQVSSNISVQGNLAVGGNGTFGGSIHAQNFIGSGAELTGVNADLLDGQPGSYYTRSVDGIATLQANAALRNAPNTFTSANAFNAGLTATTISASGAVTISSAANLTGVTTISSLILGSPLGADQGGTGLTSVPAASVLYGQGGPTLGVATPAVAGLCLLSGVADVQWGSCSGSSGVSSLNGLTGAVTITGATAGAGTVTLNDASTATKGIASFNVANFTVIAGAANTIQNITTTSSPTFAGVNTNAITPSAALTVGAVTQALTVQGSTTSITATSGGITNTLSFATPSGSNKTITIPNATGTVAVSAIAPLALDAAGNLTVANATTAAKGVASFNATNFTVASGAANTIQDIATTSSPSFAAVTAPTINASTITPSSSFTAGATSQAFTLQGNASSVITTTGGGFTTTVGFTGTPTGTVTYNFDRTSAAGTYTICSTAGNCAGVGGGVTTSGGTANRIAKFTASQGIGNSSLSDTGTSVTLTPISDAAAVFQVQNAAGHSALNVDTATGKITLGNITASAGQGLAGNLVFADGTADNFGVTLSAATLTGNRAITIPNAAGTIAVSAAGPLALDAAGNLTCPTCLTSGGGGGSAGVSSLDGLTGALTLANSTGTSTTVTINDASTAQKGIASFNSTNFTASSGAINTIQDIATTSAPNFGQLTITSSQAANDMLVVNNTNLAAAGNLINLQLNGSSKFSITPAGNLTNSGTINGQTINATANLTGSLAVGTTLGVSGLATLSGGATVTGTLAANTITPSSSLTIGATGQAFTLQGNASSTITATGGGFTTTVGFTGTPTGAVTYQLDRSVTPGTYTVCTTVGNCAGVGGSITGAGTAGQLARFTASGTIGDSILADDGTTLTVAAGKNLSLSSGAGTLTQTYNATTGTGATLAATDSAASGITTLKAQAINLIGTNTTGTNNLYGLNFGAVTNPGGTNNFYALNFGTGFTDLLRYNNATTLITGGGLINGAQLQASSVANAALANSSLTVTAGTGLTGGGGVSLGGSTSLAVAYGSAANTAVQGNVTLTCPAGSGNLSGAGTSITLGSGGVCGSLDTVASPSFTGLTVTGLASGALYSNAGVLTSETNLAVSRGGTGAGTFTANGVLYGNGTGALGVTTGGTTGQCLVATTAAAPSWAACTGLVTLQNAYNNSTDPEITLGAAATAGFTIRDNATPVAGNLFEVQNNAGGTNYFAVASTGISTSGNVTASGTYNTNTFTSSALTFGAAGTATIQSAAGQALTLISNAGATWSTSAGDLTLQAAGILNLGTGGGTTINVGTNNAAHTIGIGNTGATGAQAITIGGSGNTANTLTLEAGTAAAAIQIGNGATAHSIQIGTGAAVQALTLGSTNTSSSLILQAGTGNLNLNSAASTIVKPTADSTTAFQVQTAGSSAILTTDTSNLRVGVDVTYAAMTTPTGLNVGAATAGGSLTATTTYFYKVTSLDAAGGETAASTEASAATTGTNKTLPVTWNAVAHSSGYKVYRATSTGAEVYLTTVLTNSFTDAGTITAGSATPPSTTTAYVSTNVTNNQLQLSIGGNGTPTSQLYVSGIVPSAVTGSVATGTTPTVIRVVGNYAYITNFGSNNFQIFNIATPAAPVLVSTTSTGSNTSPAGIAIRGNYAYIAYNNSNAISGGKLAVFNIANPNSPSLVGFSYTDVNPSRVTVQGNYAYVTTGNNTLQIFSLANPANPTKVGSITTGASSSPLNAFVQGNYAYVTDNGTSNDFQIFDVSNPASPTSISTTALGGTGYGISVVGTYAYVTVFSTSTLKIFDVSNPASPTQVGSVTAGSNLANIYVQGRYAYVASKGNSTLQVFDVSNPYNPLSVGNTSTATNPLDLGVKGTYAYVIANNGAVLQTFNLGGAYSQQLQVGGLEAGALQAGDTTINGTLTAQSGLNVGTNAQINGNLGLTGNLQTQGTLAVAGGIQGGATINGLSTPAAPAITNQGTGGGTPYSYTVAAVAAAGGSTPASSAGSATGNATLDGTNFNQITWTQVSGAVSYNVYRTVGGATQGLIGNTNSTRFNDTGLAASGSAPTLDSSGQLTVNGFATFKPTTDSSTAFQIQSASAVALLTADTTSERLYVGPTAGDTVGALLVLGNKTNSGDPTGINGAMYYNSNIHEFRCYRDSNWEPCGINPIDRGFTITDEFLGGENSSCTATNNTTGELGWHVNIIGASCTINFNGGVPTASADHPGELELNTTGGANTGAILGLSSPNGDALILGSGYDMKTTVGLDITSSQAVLRVGLVPSSFAASAGTTTQPLSGVWFEADPATNSHWRYCTGDGTTATCTNSTVLLSSNNWARLEIRITATGTNTSAATFIMNGTSASVSGVTIDTTNRVSPTWQCYGTTATTRACYWDYFQLYGIASAAR